MIDVIVGFPGAVVGEWRHARELTSELSRWDPLNDDDSVGIRGLVVRDLVPWVSMWSPVALEQLRRALCLGLTSDSARLRHMTDTWAFAWDPIDDIWWPLWEAVFGGEPEVFVLGEVRLVESLDERRELEERLFGGPFVPPDPVEVWEWLRPARAAELELRLNAESRIGLYETWEDVGSWLVGEVDGVLKRQGLAAIDVAAGWFRSGEAGLWAPPDEGEVKVGRGERVLTDPLLRPFATQRMAELAPRPGSYSVLADGTKVERPVWAPMGDLVGALVDAGKALGLPEGDLGAAASTAREVEAGRPSQCEVYGTWAVVAEATQKSLEDDLILRFVPL